MATPPTAIGKLTGYDLYRALGSPKYVVAPMVDQSELAWRRLSRKYGAQLVYTPMINAKLFVDSTNKTYRTAQFDIPSGEEGDPSDRPLIVQFCANDPEQLLASAEVVAPYCDAVDLNLGCPQDIAKKGRYGSFLQDEWELIYKLINFLHKNLSVPVTRQVPCLPHRREDRRVREDLESAGRRSLHFHGRLRGEQRVTGGERPTPIELSGVADWLKIRAVKQAVSVPVSPTETSSSNPTSCVPRINGCDGCHDAPRKTLQPRPLLGLPQNLFHVPTHHHRHLDQRIRYRSQPPCAPRARKYMSDEAILRRATRVVADRALEYIRIVKALRHGRVARAGERPKPQKGSSTVEGEEDEAVKNWLSDYIEICEDMKRRMARDEEEYTKGGTVPLRELVKVDERGLEVFPWWLVQPYWRRLPPVVVKEGGKEKEGKKSQ
ncbi:dihydrouridine synthase-domain-containing protein [Ephemerocybe angulata]|uniref:tRNA-dihydrouridine(16/17) synthase [NAD(P)(+)] n=1 Tax=Ephemerocybe angulata TaxID=980116 RepID=A0A8H6HLL3_9AGAR|nr:dihydrouridine synthase-domain-containing protein [Tulosesus angulatus]